MSVDMMLAREEVENGWNLAIGEPAFLRKHVRFPKDVLSSTDSYPSLTGHPPLVAELKLIYGENRHICITNGAKHALSAAFYQLAGEGWKKVYHSPPYWPSFPTLVSERGLTFTQYYSEDCATIVTSPNNPCGSELVERLPIHIWDGVYASPVYGCNYVQPSLRQIGGAAKFLGLSGARVGWLVTESEEIARTARKFVEITTSGVSTVSQAYVANALLLKRTYGMEKEFAAARKELIENGQILLHYLGSYLHDIQGVPSSQKGMFAYVRVPQKDLARWEAAFKKSKVSAIKGVDCGDPRPGFYRFSMGQTNDYTECAIKALKREL